ncbi:MAG: ATP-binding cassette domain-containing protein [Enhygromyxa sp.]
MREALTVHNVRAGYGQRTVLCGLAAEFPWASVSAVLGPGGSGKSTLLRMLAGATPELWCSGEIPRCEAWLLPQEIRSARRPELDPGLVTGARAELQAWLAEHPTALTDEHREALQASARALLRVARILAAQAEVLLLDEPDTDLDQPTSFALAELLRSLARAGRTILLVTHNLALVDQVADHLVLLIDGVKLDEGPPARVRAQPASARVRDFFIWGA